MQKEQHDIKPYVQMPEKQTMNLDANKYAWTPIIGSMPSVSNYDHTILMTPLGKFIIEWKGWKESPDYGITFRDNDYIGTEYTLNDAKQKVIDYLAEKLKELNQFLNAPLAEHQ